jgi:hypothetical protein
MRAEVGVPVQGLLLQLMRPSTSVQIGHSYPPVAYPRQRFAACCGGKGE